MITLATILLYASTFNTSPPIPEVAFAPDPPCKYRSSVNFTGNSFSGRYSGDIVTPSGENFCCNDVIIQITALSDYGHSAYQVKIEDSCDPLNVEYAGPISPPAPNGGWMLEFWPPDTDNCGCTYTYTLQTLTPSGWIDVADVDGTVGGEISCSTEECEE